MQIKILYADTPNFQKQLIDLLAFETVTDNQLIQTVDTIIQKVRQNGDNALLELTQTLDKHPATSINELFIDSNTLKQAFDNLADDVKHALELSAGRIFSFHQHQKESGFLFTDELGNTLGQKVTPLDRVGIYVPGGLALAEPKQLPH